MQVSSLNTVEVLQIQTVVIHVFVSTRTTFLRWSTVGPSLVTIKVVWILFVDLIR